MFQGSGLKCTLPGLRSCKGIFLQPLVTSLSPGPAPQPHCSLPAPHLPSYVSPVGICVCCSSAWNLVPSSILPSDFIQAPLPLRSLSGLLQLNSTDHSALDLLPGEMLIHTCLCPRTGPSCLQLTPSCWHDARPGGSAPRRSVQGTNQLTQAINTIQFEVTETWS